MPATPIARSPGRDELRAHPPTPRQTSADGVRVVATFH
jgi:hypothetical protein